MSLLCLAAQIVLCVHCHVSCFGLSLLYKTKQSRTEQPSLYAVFFFPFEACVILRPHENELF